MMQIEALLPDALVPIVLPNGWTLADGAGALTLVAPEGDLRVSFVAASKHGSPIEIAAGAWRLVDAGFDLPVFDQAEAAPGEGWDGTHQIVYSTPAAESRSALAIVRMLGERAYVNLLYGTKAGLSRRMAQIGEAIEAWRPEGHTEIDLSGREAARWSEKESDALAEFVRRAMGALRVPGAAVAVVQDGAVVFSRGFGVAGIDDPRPVTTETRFMIGSTTKSLTTLMMARMVEAGRFDWETPVTDLLPGFALADPDVTAKLQVRHTVGASTGMPRRDTDLIFRTRGISAADRIAEMKEMLPTTGFGETFQYSNYLVAAGGYAAARAFAPDDTLEKAYERAMRELVFEPLGMTRTSVPPRDARDEDQAVPHALDLDGNVVRIDPALEHFAEAIAPSGAAWSTAPDIARYVALELAGGAAPNSRRQPQIKIGEKSSYGLGLILTEEQGLAVVSHGGNTLGFTSDMFFLPDKGLGAVILTNMAAANACTAAVRQRIFELVFAAPSTSGQMVSSTAKSIGLAVESRRKRVETDAGATAWLQLWIGEYRSNQLGGARISHTGTGYRADFDSWGSELGAETQRDGAKLIVLTSPPWSGALRLQPAASGNELVLDGAQTKYVFRRVGL
jgi:CubicO group peptidase (beta-lactamase class C family)